MILGADLAQTLRRDGRRRRSTLLTPEVTVLTPMGPMPRSRPLEVVGTFQLRVLRVRLRRTRSSSMPTAEHAARRRRPGPDPAASSRDMDRRAADPRAAAGASWAPDYHVEDWTELNQPLYSALLAREGRDLAHHRPDRDGRRAQHRRVARAARDGEEPRHRDPADDGRAGRGAIRRIFMLQGLTIGLVGTRRGHGARPGRRAASPIATS